MKRPAVVCVSGKSDLQDDDIPLYFGFKGWRVVTKTTNLSRDRVKETIQNIKTQDF